jgi:hypothetical protein
LVEVFPETSNLLFLTNTSLAPDELWSAQTPLELFVKSPSA